ncbi:hypothetical protein NECID01_1314 [Nematocida sp. AWRm77]|nr:hypothetical protein NECID01_1314 [Nematocida sp. AWRm77]
MQRIYKCTRCHKQVSSLVQLSSGSASTLRHALCPHCKQVSDPYAISQSMLVWDLLLFKTEPFIHMAHNTNWSLSLPYLALYRVFLMCVSTLGREGAGTAAGTGVCILQEVLEQAFFSAVCACKAVHTRNLFFLSTALSSFSLIRVPIVLLAAPPHAAAYLQAANIVGMLLVSKGTGLATKQAHSRTLLVLLLSKMLSAYLLHKEFQI